MTSFQMHCSGCHQTIDAGKMLWHMRVCSEYLAEQERLAAPKEKKTK